MQHPADAPATPLMSIVIVTMSVVRIHDDEKLTQCQHCTYCECDTEHPVHTPAILLTSRSLLWLHGILTVSDKKTDKDYYTIEPMSFYNYIVSTVGCVCVYVCVCLFVCVCLYHHMSVYCVSVRV